MEETLNSVMRKIQKLKKLYEGAKKINSENEAQLAFSMMQKLLTQYNLTMSEVGDAETENKNEVMHETMSGYTYKSIGGWWEQRLTYVICKWNFCRCYTVGSGYKRLIIVGRKENVEMVNWLRDMLMERYVAFSKDRYKEYLKTLEAWDKPMSKDKFQRSYLVGCAVGLDAKLQEEHEREKKEEVELAAQINALVVRNDAALTEYVEKMWKVKNGGKHKENFDAARRAGVMDGKNTELHKPIAGGKAAISKVKLLG